MVVRNISLFFQTNFGIFKAKSHHLHLSSAPNAKIRSGYYVVSQPSFLSQSFVNLVFVAYVEDNATMSSIRYFENHVLYFVQKPKEVDPISRISLRQISASIALKYIINNSV